jgi:hypothetical protein
MAGGSGTAVRHSTQITTQDNTPHKTTQTIQDTLHTMNNNANTIQLMHY